MNACISDGNSKLGKIPNVSLVPVKDCGDIPCAKDCYALKALRAYPTVKVAWSRNSALARSNRYYFFRDIVSYLEKNSPRFFRWHVAGDILDQDYLEQMKSVAVWFPAVRFLAFTKRHDLDYRNLPSNLSIVASMWPGWGSTSAVRRQGLRVAWMQDGTEKRAPKTALECPGSCETCGMCWNLKKLGRDVVFHKH